MHARRPITLAVAAATALTLITACAQQPLKPLNQGTVKDKRGHFAYRTPTYTDTYRNKNCRTVVTNALTLSAFTVGKGGGAKSKPAPPAKKPAPAAPKKENGTRTTKRVCDRVRVSHTQTGWHHNPAHWELKLKKGNRTEWVTVTKGTWDRARINHKIKI